MNYKESTITGEIKTWRRAKRIVIENPYNQTPTVRFVEEDITSMPDGSFISQNESQITAEYTDPTNSFSIINTETGEVVGTSTDMELMVLLFSKYIDLAGKRDYAEANPVIPEVPTIPTEEGTSTPENV